MARAAKRTRGVYQIDWRGPNGERMLTARDSMGRAIAERVVRANDADIEVERLLLWTFLNVMDPAEVTP